MIDSAVSNTEGITVNTPSGGYYGPNVAIYWNTVPSKLNTPATIRIDYSIIT